MGPDNKLFLETIAVAIQKLAGNLARSLAIEEQFGIYLQHSQQGLPVLLHYPTVIGGALGDHRQSVCLSLIMAFSLKSVLFQVTKACGISYHFCNTEFVGRSTQRLKRKP